MSDSMQLDTVIIGGGITGLYTCYQLLKQKGPGHKIALFEKSERFGGRIETIEMDGFLAEFGPMRFEKKRSTASYEPYPGIKTGNMLFSALYPSH